MSNHVFPTGILFNAPVCVLAKVLKHVTASAAETELSAICANAREATLFRQALQDMGHPQGPAPVNTDNTTADGITSEKMKAKHLKGADNRLHWMKDRVAQGQFDVHWESAETNLADHASKHHSPAHHRKVRPICTHQGSKSPSTVQGCVNTLKGLAGVRHPTCKEECGTRDPAPPSNAPHWSRPTSVMRSHTRPARSQSLI